jgi:hypothetical protein
LEEILNYLSAFYLKINFLTASRKGGNRGMFIRILQNPVNTPLNPDITHIIPKSYNM